MLDPYHPIAELLRRDRRYDFDAYLFVFESLKFAQDVLGLGTEQLGDPAEHELEGERCEKTNPQKDSQADSQTGSSECEEPERRERHLTGQELCEAIRLYALEQYGYMAKSVLNHWGVRNTGDFGEIVFNLIEIGQMRKTNEDTREDFNDVFDFDQGLCQSFQFTTPD